MLSLVVPVYKNEENLDRLLAVLVDLNAEFPEELEQVKTNFQKYELLDEVRFLAGWFRDTLPQAPIECLAIIRLDGDMYESTYIALTSLYPKLSPGGFVIVDDYGALPNCRAAIDDYRKANDITAPILEIDWTGVYWKKK